MLRTVSLFIAQCVMLITAYRGHARVFIKDLEAVRPSAILDIIRSGESFVLDKVTKKGMKAMRE